MVEVADVTMPLPNVPGVNGQAKVSATVPFAAAVTSPLPFTVMLALVKLPTLVFTVAKVPAAVTLPLPSKLGEVYAKSPVMEMVRPVCNAVAVPALPPMLKDVEEVATPTITPALLVYKLKLFPTPIVVVVPKPELITLPVTIIGYVPV